MFSLGGKRWSGRAWIQSPGGLISVTPWIAANARTRHMENPFDSIESAHQYISLLAQTVREVGGSIRTDIAEAAGDGTRRVDALRLVDYKLTQLEAHLVSSGRLLNDLRALRRILLSERGQSKPTLVAGELNAAG
jgi:hypothetical protein